MASCKNFPLLHDTPCNDEIPYELSSVCRFVSPKQDRKSYHLLRDARYLPCGNAACLDCIIDAIKRNGGFVQCAFQEQDHVVSCLTRHTMTSEEAEKLLENKDYKEVIGLNYEDIGRFILKNLKKYLLFLDRKHYDALKTEASVLNAENVMLVRIESIKPDLDELGCILKTQYDSYRSSVLFKNRFTTERSNFIDYLKFLCYKEQKFITSYDIGYLKTIEHFKISIDNFKIKQLRTYMTSIVGLSEIRDNKIAINGIDKNKNTSKIKIFCKRFKFIEDFELDTENLIKIYNYKNGKIYFLYEKKLVVSGSDLKGFKELINKGNDETAKFKDIASDDAGLVYLLSENQVEVYTSDGLLQFELALLDEQNNVKIINLSCILISNDKLIVSSDNRQIFVYKIGDNANSNPKNPIQKLDAIDTILCVADRLLFSLNTANKFICYEWDVQMNKFRQIYEKPLAFDSAIKLMIYLDPDLLFVSEKDLYCF